MIIPITVCCKSGEYYPHVWITHLDGIRWKSLFRFFTISAYVLGIDDEDVEIELKQTSMPDVRRIDIAYKDFPTISKEDVIRLAKEAARRWNKSHKVSYKLIIVASDQFFSIQRVEKTPEERAKELREWSGWDL